MCCEIVIHYIFRIPLIYIIASIQYFLAPVKNSILQ